MSFDTAVETFKKEMEDVSIPSNQKDFEDSLVEAEKVAFELFKKEATGDQEIISEFKSDLLDKINELKYENS